MFSFILMIGAGIILLYFGAEFLVRGSASAAMRMGITPLVVGLTVVAFATGSPELAVCLKAVLTGSGSIALGNIIGSNICNIAFVLGISALVMPIKIRPQVIKLDVPVMIGASILLAVFAMNGVIGRAEGAFLFLLLLVYTVYTVHTARKENAGTPGVTGEIPGSAAGKLYMDLIKIIIGLIGLIAGAQVFVDGAIGIARYYYINEAVIGLTIIAIGTSLPELATSVVAAIKKNEDISVGNVVGSSTFNILGIVGLTALVHPISSGGIVLLDYGVLIFIGIAVIPLMRTDSMLKRWEGGALFCVYLLYMGYLLYVRT